MNMWTEEEFNYYKGSEESLQVNYYGKAVLRKHSDYQDYILSFKELCEESVLIPRELLLYLQERVDPQNEYGVWNTINEYLGLDLSDVPIDSGLVLNIDNLKEAGQRWKD